MGILGWGKKLVRRVCGGEAPVAAFPIAVFWRSVCNLKQPVLLVRDGLQVLEATDEAYELLGVRTTEGIYNLLKVGLEQQALARIQMAVENPVATATELPVRIEIPGGYLSVTVTVSTLPAYPEQKTALVYLKDNSNPALPLWERISRDVLSRIPLPAWVVAPEGDIVFSNGSFAQFPLKFVRTEMKTQDGIPAGPVREDMERLLESLESAPSEVRRTAALVDAEYNLGPYGKWRLVHFPLKCRTGESIVGVLAMPLDAVSNKPCDEFADSSAFVGLMGQDALTHVLQVKEAERTALAREIHDSLGQELTVLKLEMRRLYNMVLGTGHSSAPVIEHFDSVRQLVDDLAKTARRIAYEMRQDLSSVHGLSHSVQEMILSLRERMGLQLQLELMPGWIEPEQGMAHHLKRSLQEMLNNVSKHSGAGRCLVRMGLSDTTYWLEVRDDGVGMGPERQYQSIGLRSLGERAEIYGGQVSIQTRPEVEGTLVRVEMHERRTVTESRLS